MGPGIIFALIIFALCIFLQMVYGREPAIGDRWECGEVGTITRIKKIPYCDPIYIMHMERGMEIEVPYDTLIYLWKRCKD